MRVIKVEKEGMWKRKRRRNRKREAMIGGAMMRVIEEE